MVLIDVPRINRGVGVVRSILPKEKQALVMKVD